MAPGFLPICPQCGLPVHRHGLRRLRYHPDCLAQSRLAKKRAARAASRAAAEIARARETHTARPDLDDAEIARRIDRHMGTFGYAGARLRAQQAYTEVRA